MDAARPFADLIPGPRGLILATLVQLEKPVTVRALARHAGVSPQSTLDTVNDLLEAGLVAGERAGTALMVVLNREHLAAEPLTMLVRLRSRLISQLSAELSSWRDLAGAWLYGSMARGDGGRDSDVDLILVAHRTIDDDEWARTTGDLRARVRAWTGNEAQLVEHTRQSFARLVKRRNPLVAAIRTDGVPLTPSTSTLLREAA
jgi:predicted nucleotidyltransferase